MHVAIVGGAPIGFTVYRGPLIREMLARGHRVSAVPGGEDPGGEDPVMLQKLRAWGADVHPFPLSRSNMNPLLELGSLGRVTGLLARLRPDLVMNFTPKLNLHGSLAARVLRIPYYPLISGLGNAFLVESRRRAVFRAGIARLMRVALAGSERVFFQNPDDRDELVGCGALADTSRTLVVNGSGVDLGHYTRAPLSVQPFVFLMIARLLRDKGLFEYLEAARMLKRQHPEVQFRLVGAFDDHPFAVSPAQLAPYQADGTVEYLGRSDDVRPHLAACSVYVLPSYHEGTPRTVLEALATGRAVITTDARGCRQTIEPGVNGLRVPVRDAGALARAMLELVRDPERVRRMGEANRQRAEQLYDVRRVNQLMLDAMGL